MKLFVILLLLSISLTFIQCSTEQSPAASATSDIFLSSNRQHHSVDPIIYYKNTTNYNDHFQSYNTRLHHEPYCYYLPTTPKEVSKAVKFALRSKLPVTIKSAGHSCDALSSANDAVVIDMSLMKKIKVDTRRNQATVESGVTWLEVYNATTPFGLATPGGSCPTVAVGGLVLGGGANYLSPAFGYSCDNVIEMSIVNARGHLVTASKYENSDLFWAMRGGGHGGFGILVSVTYKLHAIPDLLYSNKIRVPFTSFEPALLFIDQYSRTMEKSIYLNMFSGITAFAAPGKPPKVPFISINFFYGGNATVGQQKFFQFFDEFKLVVPNITTNATKDANPFYNIIAAISDPPPSRTYVRGRMMNGWTQEKAAALKTFLLPPALPYFNLSNDPKANLMFEMYFHGGAMNEKPSDYNAFVHRNASWSMSIALNYYNASHDELFGTWDSYVRDQLFNFSDYIYQNYPDADHPNWANAYYGTNYARLQSIKARYDPRNFFNYKQSVVPKRRPHRNDYNDSDNESDNDYSDSEYNNQGSDNDDDDQQ
ncbi:hypothetical protein SAMD00019534_053760 [Acytostelium subglobosum LB1]|uniref:hypothetical protein n=1 Tax=Acytostelium subglobosum LB1 TaxID=1410327 RepID=UPI000644E6AA|nr:hypothetical protein SAMD00019534_053760 [Acytostelium subglobosum LB1]GAM22201.1 hypothetical protein SAMD00019534_053760 [Acytostelium subglobosum LB1]|eukprot:XP_012755301.1 hypothetical protein SAMD00019534_053760 [Acytostelium subglobosum LB1]